MAEISVLWKSPICIHWNWRRSFSAEVFLFSRLTDGMDSDQLDLLLVSYLANEFGSAAGNVSVKL